MGEGSPASSGERLSTSRIATALLGWPALALFLFRAPHVAFALLVLLACVLALHEFHELCGPRAGGRRTLALMLALAVCVASVPGRPDVLLAALVVACLALATAAAVVGGDLEETSRWVGVAVAGILYVALPLSLLVLMRREPGGTPLVAMLVLANWARDVGAFLTGRAVRGRPLRADLNPGKHLAGAVGGLLMAALAIAGLHRVAQSSLGHWELGTLALAVGLFGQAGDLFESLLKRAAGARHSGRLLGDQGGVLDSIDGLLFAAPAAYVGLHAARLASQSTGVVPGG
jgi:phosphatidate cytidylyltransferase